jgi:cytoskeletal protein RodZ
MIYISVVFGITSVWLIKLMLIFFFIQGVVIEEIVEDSSEPSSTQRSSSTGYTVSEPHERAGNSKQPDSSESLRNDPATVR